MDTGGAAKICGQENENGKLEKPNVVGANETKEVQTEKQALLSPQAARGSMARKGRKEVKRRVQWSDCHGEKLVRVLQFVPSDSSDSEDETLDTCICAVM